MPIKELKEKYGNGNNISSIAAMNRAVRAEIPGSVPLFQLLRDLFPQRTTEEGRPIYEKLELSLDEMRHAIALKYDLKNRKECVEDEK